MTNLRMSGNVNDMPKTFSVEGKLQSKVL